jgi:hypothetical protein
MGDGFTIWIYNEATIEKIRLDKNLTFLSKLDELSGEYLDYPKIAEVFGLKFIISNHKKHGRHLEITGNIHKYKKQVCNYGDFSVAEMFDAFYELIYKYEINPFDTKLVSFEFGVNLLCNNSNYLIEQFITYKAKIPTVVDYNNNDGLYKYIKSGEYKLKLYNKAAHCKIRNKEIFRVELRCGTSKVLRRFGLSNLADLLKIDSLLRVKEQLKYQLSNSIIYDKPLDLSLVTEKEKKLLIIFKNPQGWVDFVKEKPLSTYRKRKRIQGLIEKCLGFSPNKKMIDLIEAKYRKLDLSNDDKNHFQTLYKRLEQKFHNIHTL